MNCNIKCSAGSLDATAVGSFSSRPICLKRGNRSLLFEMLTGAKRLGERLVSLFGLRERMPKIRTMTEAQSPWATGQTPLPTVIALVAQLKPHRPHAR